jgi:hypothetical protein
MAERAYEFEKFPRGKLPACLPRRQFFTGLINEIRAFTHEEEHPVFRLDDLGDMEDHDLAQVIPIQLPCSEIYHEDGYMWGRALETKKGVRLFPVNSEAAFVLDKLDGNHRINDAARSLAEHSGWEKPKAFAYVRGVFLWMVLAKLYVPKYAGNVYDDGRG